MTPVDLALFRFLLASGGCVAAGLGVWGLTLLLRRLPGLQLQRTPWLLGQLTIALAFLVILLPHGERLRMVPAIELESGSAAIAPLAAPAVAAGAVDGRAPVPGAETAGPSWLGYTARIWLMAYLLGLAYALARLLHGQSLLRALAGAGRPLATADVDAGMPVEERARTLAVIEVDAPVSPMLFGLFRPRLILPRQLRSADPLQRQMMIEHELTHLRRRDLHWTCAGLALQLLFWFNPFMRLLQTQLAWAQELGCDRDVLARRPHAQRRAYAAALVAQLRTPRTSPHSALAFGGVSAATVAQRIALIREPCAPAGAAWARTASIAGLGLIVAASLVFQPALAGRTDPSAAYAGAAGPALSCTLIVDAASGERLLEEGHCGQRVTPASTFNIAVSLMGYDSGILRDERAPRMQFKEGYPDWIEAWRADTDPGSWMGNSVLWYAQQVTAQLGAERFGRYVRAFGYGNEDVSGDAGQDNGLTMSWVGSSLAISPVEQTEFLRRLVKRRLGLSDKAYDMTARIMPSTTLANGWTVHGKTGTASPVRADGKDDETQQYGWYVGWAQKDGRSVVFVRLLLDRRHESSAAGPRLKAVFLSDLPDRLDRLRLQ